MNNMGEKALVLSGWITSGGGPLIVMPSSLLPDWFGSYDPPTPREAKSRWDNPDDPATDYDRACDINSYLGSLSVGYGTALVFGQDPVDSYVITIDAKNIVIVRLVLADDSDIENAINDLFVSVPDEQIFDYKPVSSNHVLFDSAYPGSLVEQFIEFDLPEPLYTVNTYIFSPDKNTIVVSHRFASV